MAVTWRPARAGSESPVLGASRRVRLDLAINPFGPCPATIEVLENVDDTDESETAALELRLRERLRDRYRVSCESIMLSRGTDTTIARLLQAIPGPVVSFSPALAGPSSDLGKFSAKAICVARGAGRSGSVPPEIALDLPPESVAIIDSPANPLGTILAATDVVRLARACRLVIVDERFAEFAGASLLPLALEFENIVVLRSFAPWTGIADLDFGWVVRGPRWTDELFPSPELQTPAVAAVLATMDELPAVEATLRLVREERSRLYRLLRRLSFLRPLPSWGPFVAARVEFVPRHELVSALESHRIVVHAPAAEGLEQYIRIGIGTRSDMEALRTALLEIAPSMIGESLGRRDAGPDRFALSREEGFEPERGEIDHVLEIATAKRASLRR